MAIDSGLEKNRPDNDQHHIQHAPLPIHIRAQKALPLGAIHEQMARRHKLIEKPAAQRIVLEHHASRIADDVRVFPNEIDDLVTEGDRSGLSLIGEARARHLGDLLIDINFDRGLQLGFGLEMVLHKAGRNARRLRHGADGCGSGALICEQPERGVANPRIGGQV